MAYQNDPGSGFGWAQDCSPVWGLNQGPHEFAIRHARLEADFCLYRTRTLPCQTVQVLIGFCRARAADGWAAVATICVCWLDRLFSNFKRVWGVIYFVESGRAEPTTWYIEEMCPPKKRKGKEKGKGASLCPRRLGFLLACCQKCPRRAKRSSLSTHPHL